MTSAYISLYHSFRTLLERQTRLELAAPCLEGRCSNQIEPLTHITIQDLRYTPDKQIITHPYVSPEFPPTKQHIGNNSATRETSLSQRKPTAASCPSKSQKSYAGLSTDKFHPPFRKIFLIERLGLLLPITHVIPSLHWFTANSLIWLSQNISNCHIGIYLGYSPTGASIAAAVRMVPFATMHIDAIYKR